MSSPADSGARRILVTGGRGCIGQEAVRLLVERGWDTHVVTSRKPPAEGAGATWHVADLLRGGEPQRVLALVRPQALLHLAWYVAPGQWATAPENVAWVSTTLALAQAFARYGGRRLVVSGSCLEYDWNFGYCSERLTPCSPHTLYGACKHATHLLLNAGAVEPALSVAWARVFFVYGPHEHPARFVATVVRSLLAGDRAPLSHGSQVRDYLYSGDVARAFIALLESDLCGPINVASGEATTLRTIALRAGELIDRPDLLAFGAIPAAATDRPLVVADVTRLRTELGWRPSCTLDEGLEFTIQWWRRQPRASATVVASSS